MTPFSTCHCSTSKTTEKGKQTPVGLAALSKFCLVKIEHNSISLEVPLASIETTRTSLRLQAGVSLSCILSCLTILVGSSWLCSEVQSAWSALWVLFRAITSLLVTWEQQHSFHPTPHPREFGSAIWWLEGLSLIFCFPTTYLSISILVTNHFLL